MACYDVAVLARLAETRTSSRLRLAVTAEEYEAVRRHCLREHGHFLGRLRGVPLVVEEDPIGPPLMLELA